MVQVCFISLTRSLAGQCAPLLYLQVGPGCELASQCQGCSMWFQLKHVMALVLVYAFLALLVPDLYAGWPLPHASSCGGKGSTTPGPPPAVERPRLEAEPIAQAVRWPHIHNQRWPRLW